MRNLRVVEVRKEAWAEKVNRSVTAEQLIKMTTILPLEKVCQHQKFEVMPKNSGEISEESVENFLFMKTRQYIKRR